MDQEGGEPLKRNHQKIKAHEKGASAQAAKSLDGSDKVFGEEGLLIPVIPDDPLLRMSNPVCPSLADGRNGFRR